MQGLLLSQNDLWWQDGSAKANKQEKTFIYKEKCRYFLKSAFIKKFFSWILVLVVYFEREISKGSSAIILGILHIQVLLRVS